MSNEHFSGLSPAEAERLALLAEECGEVVQIVSKILRHGYESYNPNISVPRSNRTLLIQELGDVVCAIGLLDAAGDVSYSAINAASTDKLMYVQQYLHHNKIAVAPGLTPQLFSSSIETDND